MNKYIGKICPYCKSAFKEDDEIVVCSDCEMPHHKDCWIDNKGCTTFGCQGTIQGIEIEVDTAISSAPKYEVREAQTQPVQEQPAFCSRCGSPLVAGNAFCSKCGAPVLAAAPQPTKNEYAQKINEVTSKVSAELKSAMEEYRTSDTMDPELAKYIGSKSDYYLNVFGSLKSTNKYNSWNWFAFLISPFWCMYRKMYIPGGIILAIDFVLAMIGGVFTSILALGIAVVVGLFANYFYMYDVEQRMNKGKALQEPQKSQYVEKYGDTNATVPSVAAVIYVLLCVILFV